MLSWTFYFTANQTVKCYFSAVKCSSSQSNWRSPLTSKKWHLDTSVTDVPLHCITQCCWIYMNEIAWKLNDRTNLLCAHLSCFTPPSAAITYRYGHTCEGDQMVSTVWWFCFYFQWLQYYTGTGYTFRETAASLVEEQCMIGPVILSGHRANTVGRRHDEVKFYCLGITVMILYLVPSWAFAITSQPPLPLMPFPFLPLPSDPHSHPKWPVVKVSWSPVNEEVDLLARQQWKRWGGEEWNPQKPASKHSY